MNNPMNAKVTIELPRKDAYLIVNALTDFVRAGKEALETEKHVDIDDTIGLEISIERAESLAETFSNKAEEAFQKWSKERKK